MRRGEGVVEASVETGLLDWTSGSNTGVTGS